MVYKAIGLMSGSSLDGLDMAYVHIQETGGRWTFEIVEAHCYPYTTEWKSQLKDATSLSALDYQLLHTAYGHYMGELVNRFINDHSLQHKVDLLASHGHTVFHVPSKKMTAQLGDGAAVAAITGLPVISDLRALDIALGGQGAPIVPIGEKLLLYEYEWLLNLGGIANLSARAATGYIAFDVCPANRILDMLAGQAGKEYDADGKMAERGRTDSLLLQKLNGLEYYGLGYPKSLANDFGTGEVYPLIKTYGLKTEDALRTYVEHICMQVKQSVLSVVNKTGGIGHLTGKKILVTGGGAMNIFLIHRLTEALQECGLQVIVPDAALINFKEATVMALMGVLRWREEYNVLSSVTGAARNSIGGALWMGAEA